MVRTKASCSGIKVAAAKAPRKYLPATSGSSDHDSLSAHKENFGGRNPVCKRPTPEWQKLISTFFISNSEKDDDTSPSKMRKLSGRDKENRDDKKENKKGDENQEKLLKKIQPPKKVENSSEPSSSGSSISGTSGAKSNGCIVSVNDDITEED